MPTFTHWLGDTPAADFDATSIVQRDPVSLVLTRSGVAQAAQTARIVPARSTGTATELRGIDGGTAGEVMVTVIGDGDLDIRREDRFMYKGAPFLVITVDKTMNNKVEALARGIQ